MAQRQSGFRFFFLPGTKRKESTKYTSKNPILKWITASSNIYMKHLRRVKERLTWIVSLEYLLDFYDVWELTEKENGKRCCFITIMWMFCHLFSSTICYGIFKSFNSSRLLSQKRLFYCWHGRKFVNSRGVNKRRVQMSNACATNGTWKETNALSECTFLLLELLEILLLC